MKRDDIYRWDVMQHGEKGSVLVLVLLLIRRCDVKWLLCQLLWIIEY